MTNTAIGCHAGKFGGDGGNLIYTRADRRVKMPLPPWPSRSPPATPCWADHLFPEDELHLGRLSQRPVLQPSSKGRPLNETAMSETPMSDTFCDLSKGKCKPCEGGIPPLTAMMKSPSLMPKPGQGLASRRTANCGATSSSPTTTSP
jgi:hypothetical protein